MRRLLLDSEPVTKGRKEGTYGEWKRRKVETERGLGRERGKEGREWERKEGRDGEGAS